jgi:hypothetical protein
LRDGEEDCSCVLSPQDYPNIIRHNTVVMYRRAQWSAVMPLENMHHYEQLSDLPSATLAKILEGALLSDFVRERFKKIIRDSMK